MRYLETSGRRGTIMKYFARAIDRTATWMYDISGLILVLTMLLTVCDVVMRTLGRPVIATYEIVTWSAAMIVAFAIPRTSMDNGHVVIEFLVGRQSKLTTNILSVLTRILGILLFMTISWYLVQKGSDLHTKGDVTDVLKVPVYPLAYAISFCCFVESVVLLMQTLKVFLGENKNE
jgi:TRAP-type C4-dicarboxylate transport system permease small subunit